MKKTAFVFLIYSLMVLIGGLIGHWTKGSLPSLYSGLIFGTLLCANSIWMFKSRTPKPLYCALIITFLLDGFFTYRFAKTGVFFPAGIMSFASLAAIVLLVARIRKLATTSSS